jgi:uncharacterized repeat protein (TIGR03803 family)
MLIGNHIENPGRGRSLLHRPGRGSFRVYMMPTFAQSLPVILTLACLGGGAVHAANGVVVYSFQGGSNGGIPYAGLVLEHGAFYGAADIGGAGCDPLGCGYVYKLTPPAKGQSTWGLTVLYKFAGGDDGAFPQARLRFDPRGNLYGSTTSGGRANVGTVFRLAPPAAGQTAWTETVLHQFSGSDGQTPLGRLSLDRNGSIYGTTELGGPAANGVAFRLDPPRGAQSAWTETVLHNFTGGSDGGVPLGGLIEDQAGRLYGTTMRGGTHGQGTAFRLAPANGEYAPFQETVVYDFAGAPDGAQPVAGLIFDDAGNLYGQTSQGGTGRCFEEAGCGTVFKLSPPPDNLPKWTETVLHSFAGGNDGSFPNSTLALRSDGAIVGATSNGGTTGCDGAGCGIIFSLSRPAASNMAWPEQIVRRFDDSADGSYPNSIVLMHDGAIIGTTSQGGSPGCNGLSCGVIFKLLPVEQR